MKVYLVVANFGIGDDSWVIAVYADEAKAKAYAQQVHDAGTHNKMYVGSTWVQEFEVQS